MGMLAGEIASGSGRLGSSVQDLVPYVNLQDPLDSLSAFILRLSDWDVRVNDLNTRNIVLGYRGGHNQFVVVDGLGNGTATSCPGATVPTS